jgi:hypothetical protein
MGSILRQSGLDGLRFSGQHSCSPGGRHSVSPARTALPARRTLPWVPLPAFPLGQCFLIHADLGSGFPLGHSKGCPATDEPLSPSSSGRQRLYPRNEMIAGMYRISGFDRLDSQL